jgi:hypothetical protein
VQLTKLEKQTQQTTKRVRLIDCDCGDCPIDGHTPAPTQPLLQVTL